MAGLFCLVMAAAMVVLFVQDKQTNPLVAAVEGDMAKAKVKLRAKATPALQTQVREMDAAVRQGFWSRHARLAQGAWLLVFGAGLLVVSVKAARKSGGRALVLGEVTRAAPPGQQAWARLSVGAMALCMVVLLASGAVWGWRTEGFALAIPDDGGASDLPIASVDELKKNWPVFRGWGGAGIVPGAWPEMWNGATGEGVVWKSPVPMEGNSSPIVWNGKVFLSGATEKKRAVFCYDATNGKLLWTADVPGAGGTPPSVHADNGFASPTMATDGARVYAIFATGDAVAVNFAGKRVWQRRVGSPKSQYGYAASLTTWEGRAIVQFDVGEGDEASGLSFVAALDGKTGAEAWKTERPVAASWCSPVVADVGGRPELVLNGRPLTMGYDPSTGQERWRAKVLEHDVAPSPVVVNGVVYVAQEMACRAAIKADGAAGTIAESDLAWKSDEETSPDQVSPVCDGELLWTVLSAGKVFCHDAKTGKMVWEHAIDGVAFKASPTLVGDGANRHLWLLDSDGKLHVLAAGKEFKELTAAALGEGAVTSPAFAGGRVFIRGEKNLYCLGSK